MRRRTLAAVASVVVILAFFFVVPIVPGITPPLCGGYLPDQHEALSFELLGTGTTYYFGQFLWHWNRPYPSDCPSPFSAGYNASLVGSNGTLLPDWTGGSYPTGQPVKINFSVIDGTEAHMTVSSRTSCIGSFMVLFGSETNATTIYDSTKDPGCSGAPVTVVLHPKEHYTQIVEWNQTDDAGTQVPPGNYWMVANVEGAFIQVGEVSVNAP